MYSILEPARIVDRPPSISVTVGDSATLESTISGSPDLKVKWFKDGKEMTSGRKYKVTLKDNIATLKILSAEKGDSCEYRMEVANRVGKDECTFAVTVLGSFSFTLISYSIFYSIAFELYDFIY